MGYRGKVFVRGTFGKGPKCSQGERANRPAFQKEKISSSKGLKQPRALESLQKSKNPVWVNHIKQGKEYDKMKLAYSQASTDTGYIFKYVIRY